VDAGGCDVNQGSSATAIERCFEELCVQAGRQGVLGFAQVNPVSLLPEQKRYLQEKLKETTSVGIVTAISVGLFYQEPEIQAVPAYWQTTAAVDDPWNEYARAYQALNRSLNHIAAVLAARFEGVAEQATVAGCAGHVGHVKEYFPNCVSHRAFAEAAGVGWRGRHGLIVTPEAGPALRLATVFVPQLIWPRRRALAGCGDCRACLEVCPVLRNASDYREACRRRLNVLGLEDEVCGICVRVCWDRVRP
jgi:epoxyqueuosine reductase QueG